ncbi:MAG: cytoplasmic filament protein CfpA [bacterium]|nr:cytoplasmic filament protein CfpA [bacterium]
MTQEKSNLNDQWVHPEDASAVGSRNSANRDGRNEYIESQRIIDEEVDKVLNHLSSKLPPEVLEKLQVTGSVKELLHNYFNQGFHNMYNRYLVTVEDEMSKKFRGLIDQEEEKNLTRYTPQSVAELVEEIGGAEQFNNEALERSVVNIYSHLQGHLEHGVSDLQARTNKLLREKTDIGLMVGTDNAFTLVKGHYSDNKIKPETVTDVSLAINVSENELLNPIFHFQTGTETIIREVLSDYIMHQVDHEISALQAQLTEEGQPEMDEAALIIERLKRLETHLDFEDGGESPQYKWLSKDFLQGLGDMGSEIPQSEYDPLNVRENIKRIVDRENMRNQGFDKAVNSLTQILDKTRLGYQHIENFKQARKVVIREYGEQAGAELPDERYAATLAYYDDEQLHALRNAYCTQIEEFEVQAQKLWEVYEKVHQNFRDEQGFLDYQSVSQIYLGGGPIHKTSDEKLGFFAKLFGGAKKKEEPVKLDLPPADEAEQPVKLWDEIFFVQPEKSDMEKLNDTFAEKRKYLTKKFQMLRGKIHDTFKYENPPERVILDQRLDFLEDRFEAFNRQVNPYHLRPGIYLEINLTTIKRKENTMQSVSNVISELLATVSAGFTDLSKEKHLEDANANGYVPSFVNPPGLSVEA